MEGVEAGERYTPTDTRFRGVAGAVRGANGEGTLSLVSGRVGDAVAALLVCARRRRAMGGHKREGGVTRDKVYTCMNTWVVEQ